jgi:hypothetical protein
MEGYALARARVIGLCRVPDYAELLVKVLARG